MLTAKVGRDIINCFDGKYDRYRLKQWSNKKILKCPICGGDYEYCHGEIIHPYFRHVGKECNGYYSESETEEHRNGKKILFDWISKQEGVVNCRLEHWIPETKQRPDIYFEYEGKKFVIEFQCSPIASEYLLRRELYKLSGINDIWILGTEKYSISIDKKGNLIHGSRYKTIEKKSKNDCIIYFDVKNKLLYANSLILPMNNEIFQLTEDLRYEKDVKRFDLYNFDLFHKDFMFIERLENFIFNEDYIKPHKEIVDSLEYIRNYYMRESKRVEQEKAMQQARYDEKIKELERQAREMELKIQKIKDSLNIKEVISEYVGTIGEEITLNLLMIERIYFSTYDSSLYKFLDEKGNALSWMTATYPNIKEGDFIELTGKVKSHSEYQDVKQTRLVRCKVGLKVRK